MLMSAKGCVSEQDMESNQLNNENTTEKEMETDVAADSMNHSEIMETEQEQSCESPEVVEISMKNITTLIISI